MARLIQQRQGIRLGRQVAGFTVLELMVAMTVSLVAMAIAAELVLEAQRRIAHSGRRNLDMSVDLAFEQIRLDLRGSYGFQMPVGGISGVFNDGEEEPLELKGHFSGKTIVYELVKRELRRVVYQGTGYTPESHRVVLKEVSLFRWRDHPDAQVLEILISHEETADMTGLVAAGQREVLEPKVRTVTMMVKQRGVLPFLGKTSW